MHARTALIAALLATAAPRLADACSAPACWAGSFLPGDGSTIPANAPGFVWKPMQDFQATGADPAQVELSANGTSIALTATSRPGGTYLLVPATPLVAGTTYTLVDHTTCSNEPGFAGPTVTFTAGPAVPLPQTLGETAVTDLGVGEIVVATGGSCSAPITAHRYDFEVVFESEADPWRDLFEITTVVDNQPWHPTRSINDTNSVGTSWTGHARDTVYAACQPGNGTDDGVAIGEHFVELRAKLPGSATELSAGTTMIALTCDGAPVDPPLPDDTVDHTAGCSSGGASGPAGLAIGLLALRRRRR